ncbi:unnamed protein product [Nezara viridula]|uniref:Uncharacterized protein n=1 Tax=Nezara viridula TaxID=85310 RepID=A0A9P0E4K0_NEZVI|nr:unnamed protein product [Nezara viridula]
MLGVFPRRGGGSLFAQCPILCQQYLQEEGRLLLCQLPPDLVKTETGSGDFGLEGRYCNQSSPSHCRIQSESVGQFSRHLGTLCKHEAHQAFVKMDSTQFLNIRKRDS